MEAALVVREPIPHADDLYPRHRRCFARVSSETRAAASPIICKACATAYCAMRDLSKSDRVSPDVNERASCAACSMSSRYASSRHIQRQPIGEYVLATNVIVASLYRPAQDQVDRSTENLSE